MTHCSTPAVVLRRVSYGDYDVILTVLTRESGKRAIIAKAAKKSTKRFAGILEPFSNLRIVFNDRQGKGMPVLQEASLIRPFASIRSDIIKTAYASYWTELIYLWTEEGQARPPIYRLLTYALGGLAADILPAEDLSVLFQMRFLGEEGFRPVLEQCSCCRKDINMLIQDRFCIDLTEGGIVCNHCPTKPEHRLTLGKGTLKQLLWIASGQLDKATRARFGTAALKEATRFLEAFVPYHLGRQPQKSTCVATGETAQRPVGVTLESDRQEKNSGCHARYITKAAD